MTEADPGELDPEYEHHGGFPEYGPATPGPGFGRFVAAMRRLQDLAVSADPADGVWDDAADRAAALVELLGPFEADEGVAPAGRTPDLPGMGSLLLPPWTLTRYAPDGVEMTGHFTRFHVGGNHAVHGGVLPLLFDHMFGMISHAAARPISRTAFLHAMQSSLYVMAGIVAVAAVVIALWSPGRDGTRLSPLWWRSGTAARRH